MSSVFEHRRIVSHDGTVIACQSAGTTGRGPAIVLSNGLGGSYATWRHLVAALDPWGFRLLSWDYRGLYRSGPPARPEALAIADHAEDLHAVLRADGADARPAVLIGWSMGVQVNFEYARRHRDRIAAIVAINGVAGRPFDTIVGAEFLRGAIPAILAFMREQARLMRTVVGAAAGWKGLVPLIQRLGLCSRTLDLDVFEDLARDFVTLDFALYARTFEHLGRHDASDLFANLGVPVLIIAGDRDLLTPVATAERMRDRIPGARLRVIAGGTHYTPVEYPEVVNAEVLAFLRENGLAPAP